ncbi:MAG: hypothetical protein AAF433_05840 [Bacteroidota bacterium]
MQFRFSTVGSLLLLPALFVLFTAFTCEDDDFRSYAPPGTFLIGYGGGLCSGFCSSIFKVQDSVLFFYEPGPGPALGDGAANLGGWVEMEDQSRIVEVFQLQDNLPEELLRASTDRFGCPGCGDGPFAQLSLYTDDFSGSRTWYINAVPLDGSTISTVLRDYALEIQALVEQLAR